jgi:hypothetical protein
VQNAEETLVKIREAIETVNGKKAEVLQEIQESFGHLRKTVDERQAEIEQEVNDMAEQYLERYNILSQSAETEYTDAQQTVERLQSMSLEERLAEPARTPKVFDEIPQSDFQLKFVCELTNAVQFVRQIGKVGKWKVSVPHTCENFTNVTYWMVPPCCYKYYCCNKCHDANETHNW